MHVQPGSVVARFFFFFSPTHFPRMQFTLSGPSWCVLTTVVALRETASLLVSSPFLSSLVR